MISCSSKPRSRKNVATAGKAGQIAAQLSMAFAVVVFAIFPLLLNRFGPEDGILWRAASGAYLTVIAALNLLRTSRFQVIPRLSNGIGKVVTVTATCGLVLLSLNFWLATDWFYLTQLFIALITSMILYLGFSYQALSVNND